MEARGKCTARIIQRTGYRLKLCTRGLAILCQSRRQIKAHPSFGSIQHTVKPGLAAQVLSPARENMPALVMWPEPTRFESTYANRSANCGMTKGTLQPGWHLTQTGPRNTIKVATTLGNNKRTLPRHYITSLPNDFWSVIKLVSCFSLFS